MTEEYILIQYKCNKHVLCSGNPCECWTREDEWNPSMAVEDLHPHRNSVGRARFLTSGDWGFWLPSIRKSGFVNQVSSERKGPSMLVTKDSNSSCNEKDNKAKESNFTESRSRLVPVPPVRWGSCARKGWPAPGGRGRGRGESPAADPAPLCSPLCLCLLEVCSPCRVSGSDPAAPLELWAAFCLCCQRMGAGSGQRPGWRSGVGRSWEASGKYILITNLGHSYSPTCWLRWLIVMCQLDWAPGHQDTWSALSWVFCEGVSG